MDSKLCEEFGGHAFSGGACVYCELLFHELPDHLLLENYVLAVDCNPECSDSSTS